MKHSFRNMILKSIKRRRKDISRVSIVAFLAAFFVMVTLLFQDNVDSFQQQENKQNYGEWFLAETTKGEDSAEYLSDNAYFDQCGIMLSGPVILDTKYSIGTANDTMLDIGNIRLRTGHMPVADNEIVMQLNLMSSLGLESNVGQTVSLSHFDSSGKKVTKDYVLSGILVNYTDNWINGSTMPAALVSQQAFDAINMVSEKNYMYHLRDTIKLKDESKYVDILGKTVKETLVYNQYAFEKGVWGDTSAYIQIIVILVCMSACALAYTYFSYISKRKTEYYRLRCFGINKLQLKKLVIYEGLYACVPSAAMGFLAALIISMILVFILKLVYHTNYFFNLRLMSLLICIVSVAVTILVSITMVTLLVNDKHIYVNTMKIPLKKLKRIKPKRLNHRNIYRKFHIREWRLHPLRILLSIVLSIAVTVFILLSVNKLNEYYTRGYGLYIDKSDFKASIKVTDVVPITYNVGMDGTTYGTGKQVYSHSDIFSQDFYDSLNSIEGIESLSYFTINSLNVITWDGIENSLVRAKQLTTFHNLKTVTDENIYSYATAFYPDSKKIYESYKDNIAPEYYDLDAFKRGEQVIYISTAASFINQGDIVEENTLAVGDKITYHTETGEIQATVVAMLYPEDYFPLLNVNSKYEYDFIGSYSLGKKIAESDHAQFGYNHLILDLSSLVSFDGTNKRFTNLFSEYKLQFSNSYEQKAHHRNAFYQKVFVFSMMVSIVFSIYVVIYANMIVTGLKYKKYNMKLLKNLGLQNKKLAWMEIRKCIGDNLLILSAVPIYYIICWYNTYKMLSLPRRWRGSYLLANGEIITNKYIAANYILLKNKLLIPQAIWITVIIFFILLLVAIVPIVKYIKNMNKEN